MEIDLEANNFAVFIWCGQCAEWEQLSVWISYEKALLHKKGTVETCGYLKIMHRMD